MEFFFSVFPCGGNMPYRPASSNLLNFLINVIKMVCSEAKSLVLVQTVEKLFVWPDE